MKKVLQSIISVVTIFCSSPLAAQNICLQLNGAKIIAQDGQFLGSVTSEFNSDSVFNEFGSFGSEFSGTSIFNEFSSYGSEFSNLSPFNEFADKPPLLIIGTQVAAVVTVNSVVPNGLNPYIILSCKESM